MGVANGGVLQEDVVEVFPHVLGDIVSAHLDVDKFAVGAYAILHILPLVLDGQEVHVGLFQSVALGVGEVRDGEALGPLELPRYALRIERTHVAHIGGVGVFLSLVPIDDDGPAVGNGKALVLSAPEVELAVVFLARAQLRFGRLGGLSPGAEGFHGLIAVLVGQQDIPIIVGLPQGLHGLHQSGRLFGLSAPGGGSDTSDFHLADKGLRKGGLALIEQGGRLANDFCIGAGAVRPVDSLNARYVAVRINRVLAGGRHEQDVEAFLLGGQRVPLHHDDYVFCHKAFLLLRF